jgi:hypothetical protein
LGETPKFSQQTLCALAERIGGDALRIAEVLAAIAVELELKEKVELVVGEQTLRNTTIQEVTQDSMLFE